MKNLLRLEEAAMFGLALFLTSKTDYPFWLYAVLFLTPDISMLGYLINTSVGAHAYNIFHHKALAITCYIIGFASGIGVLAFIGLILFGHSAFDRMLGYGLKYPDSFKNTHLGMLNMSK